MIRCRSCLSSVLKESVSAVIGPLRVRFRRSPEQEIDGRPRGSSLWRRGGESGLESPRALGYTPPSSLAVEPAVGGEKSPGRALLTAGAGNVKSPPTQANDRRASRGLTRRAAPRRGRKVTGRNVRTSPAAC